MISIKIQVGCMAHFPDCTDFYLFDDIWFLEIIEQIWIQ